MIITALYTVRDASKRRETIDAMALRKSFVSSIHMSDADCAEKTQRELIRESSREVQANTQPYYSRVMTELDIDNDEALPSTHDASSDKRRQRIVKNPQQILNVKDWRDI